jgi:hypothetical protein
MDSSACNARSNRRSFTNNLEVLITKGPLGTIRKPNHPVTSRGIPRLHYTLLTVKPPASFALNVSNTHSGSGCNTLAPLHPSSFPDKICKNRAAPLLELRNFRV